MNIKEAMSARHTVRKYKDKSLSAEVIKQINNRIDENNQQHGIHISLVTDNTDALPGIIKLVLAKGVKNYLVLAGPDKPETNEKLGYASADLMLYAQTLGLNTWWIGGTFSRSGTQKNANIGSDEKIIGIVVVGYGVNQGKPHKSKSAAEVSAYDGSAPEWFQEGVKAALLAPTAVNRQNLMITGKGDTVSMTYKEGAFAGADLGICKYHFELGAGIENFRWAD